MRVWIFLLCTLAISASALAESASPDLALSAQDGRLSVTTNQMPLERVLEAAAQELAVTVHLEPALAKNTVSVTFHNLSLTEGFDRLLEGANYVLTGEHLYVWSREETSESHPLDTSRFTVVAGRNKSTVTTKSWEDLKEEAMHAPDSAVRLAALGALVERNDGLEVLPTLLAALQDTDPEIRDYALESLGEVDEAAAIDHFVEVVDSDEDSDNPDDGA